MKMAAARTMELVDLRCTTGLNGTALMATEC